MHEGIPQEQEGESQGAFVPAAESERFADLADIGRQKLAQEEEQQQKADRDMKIAITSAVVGGAAMTTPLAPLALGALPGVVYFGAKSIAEQKGAAEAREKKEKAFGETRAIVEQEMRKGGAYDIVDTLRVTPEQVEIARQEAERSGMEITRPKDVM